MYQYYCVSLLGGEESRVKIREKIQEEFGKDSFHVENDLYILRSKGNWVCGMVANRLGLKGKGSRGLVIKLGSFGEIYYWGPKSVINWMEGKVTQ